MKKYPHAQLRDIFGDPGKSIVRLSIPIVVGVLFGAVNNVVDLIWVAGLGVDALSALGFCIPLNMIVLSLAGGLAVGGGVLVSQKIGAKDRDAASDYAQHTVVLMLLAALVFSVLMILFIKPILRFVGAGHCVDLAVSYGRILFGGIVIFFFNNAAFSVLESEGNVKRVMWAILIGMLINIIFDPILIYVLHLGVAGAAIASLLSGACVNLILIYWLYIKKITYVVMWPGRVRFSTSSVADILKQGIPVSVGGIAFSFLALVMNIIVVHLDGTDGVAVFSTGMRIVFVSLLPMMGIASAVTTLTGVAYGNREFAKIDRIHRLGIKAGMIVEGVIAVAIFVFAPQIARLFVWSDRAMSIESELEIFLKIIVLLLIAAPLARGSVGALVGAGRSRHAMAVTLIQTFVVIPAFAYLCGRCLAMGLSGIWIGLVLGNGIFAITTVVWATRYFRRLNPECARNPEVHGAMSARIVPQHIPCQQPLSWRRRS